MKLVYKFAGNAPLRLTSELNYTTLYLDLFIDGDNGRLVLILYFSCESFYS